MNRRFLLFFGSVLVFLFAVVASVFFMSARTAEGPAVGERVFVVGEGEDIRSVAGRLEDDGLVASRWYFLWSAWRGDLVGRLQAGDFVIAGGFTAPEVARLFLTERGKAAEVSLAFPEGWTAEKIAERLTANGFDGETFLERVRNPDPTWRQEHPILSDLPEGASLEGYLFPDTYTFRLDETPDRILATMIANFERRFTPEMTAKAITLYGGVPEALIMASILEKEIGSPRQSIETIRRERRMVADLFRRRIVEGMRLQSDATLEYVLGSNAVQHSASDLRTDSPYNTYEHDGLPPGPVSNPGLISIEAAIDPLPNEYWFFLNNPSTGDTVFSRTFDEHKGAKVKNGL